MAVCKSIYTFLLFLVAFACKLGMFFSAKKPPKNQTTTTTTKINRFTNKNSLCDRNKREKVLLFHIEEYVNPVKT